MTYTERQAITAARMADPQPGDRFHEMYSFWVEVVARQDDSIVAWDSATSELRLSTVEAFRDRFRYNTLSDYWVAYHDCNGDTWKSLGYSSVSELIDELVERERVKLTGESMTCASL